MSARSCCAYGWWRRDLLVDVPAAAALVLGLSLSFDKKEYIIVRRSKHKYKQRRRSFSFRLRGEKVMRNRKFRGFVVLECVKVFFRRAREVFVLRCARIRTDLIQCCRTPGCHPTLIADTLSPQPIDNFTPDDINSGLIRRLCPAVCVQTIIICFNFSPRRTSFAWPVWFASRIPSVCASTASPDNVFLLSTANGDNN